MKLIKLCLLVGAAACLTMVSSNCAQKPEQESKGRILLLFGEEQYPW